MARRTTGLSLLLWEEAQFIRMFTLPRKATEVETTKIQWQAVQQRQGMRRMRRQWQHEQHHSKRTRCWMGTWRQATQDLFPDIPSGPPHPPKVTGPGTKVVIIKADLSRPAHPIKTAGEQFINTFTCDALRGNGNEEYSMTSNKSKAYTDTDSDGKTEIITDITCKFQGKLVAMEVKVDLGTKTNCIPLSHFRCLFPQLCSEDGSPRENTLKPTLAQFEAYDGGILQAHTWIILPSRDIRDKKFYLVRYYILWTGRRPGS